MCASADATAISTRATTTCRMRRCFTVSMTGENRGQSPISAESGSDPDFLEAWHPRDRAIPHHFALPRLEAVHDVRLGAGVLDAHADALGYDRDHRAADPVALG